MAKDPRFFTKEVDGSMNIINECDKKEHSRMRRMLSYAFSMSNLLQNEDILVRRVDEFLEEIQDLDGRGKKRGIDIDSMFNYVTFNIMGEMSFGDSWETQLERQPGKLPIFWPQILANDSVKPRHHWADVIIDSTYMNDVMRAIVCVPGFSSLVERFPPSLSQKTLYRHADYALEHTEA